MKNLFNQELFNYTLEEIDNFEKEFEEIDNLNQQMDLEEEFKNVGLPILLQKVNTSKVDTLVLPKVPTHPIKIHNSMKNNSQQINYNNLEKNLQKLRNKYIQ
jgi:hypothetical protein